MGKWSENEEYMKESVRAEIIKALWTKIRSPENLEDNLKQFRILKIVLGLQPENSDEPTKQSKQFDQAIYEGNDELFKQMFENISDNTLAEIQNGEHLSLPLVDKSNPIISTEDINDLTEYMQEKNISADVSIYNSSKLYIVDHPKFGSNPVFSIHSVAKVFTGIYLMKMLSEGTMEESDLENPIQLDDDILKELSPEVQQRLEKTTLKEIMLHRSGLGDYLDNTNGLAADIEAKLNQGQDAPNITCSKDLLKYGDKKVYTEAPGEFKYSNLGMLLLGFAIEKKYQDNQRKKGEEPLLGIDDILRQFAKNDVKMEIFENKRPENGCFNLNQRNLLGKDADYITKYVSARFGCTAGGYWTTNTDLQKFGQWIKTKCQEDSKFKELIKKHGGEFYNTDKKAIEHSGIHADTAHFYTSLRKNGTIISVLSDQGDRAATNLCDSILKQTTWFKNSMAQKQEGPELNKRPPKLLPAFNNVFATEQSSKPKEDSSTLEVSTKKMTSKKGGLK